VRRLLALSVLALVFVVGASAERPLRVSGPQAQAKGAFVGFIRTEAGTRFARLRGDLVPYGARSANVGFVSAWTPQPGHAAVVAIAVHPWDDGRTPDELRFVETQHVQVLRRSVPLGGLVAALLWSEPNRVVALMQDCCSTATGVEVVDPGARRVLSRTELDGTILAIGRTGDALVVLTGPTRGIGTARITVIDALGGTRRVELSKIVAGRAWPPDGHAPMLGTQRIPALAVDPSGGHAYVVDEAGLTADVTLSSLDVGYHDLRPASVGARIANWLQPSAHAKGINGTQLHGTWLGNGFVAVSGTESAARIDSAAGEVMSETPAGVEIVDTREWTKRMLDRGGDQVTAAGDVLLVTGRRWSSTQIRSDGMGVAAYGPGETAKFHVFAGDSAWVQAVWERFAYVSVGERTRVIGLSTGRVVETRPGAVPQLVNVPGPDL
jgi:hypothetical protein